MTTSEIPSCAACGITGVFAGLELAEPTKFLLCTPDMGDLVISQDLAAEYGQEFDFNAWLVNQRLHNNYKVGIQEPIGGEEG